MIKNIAKVLLLVGLVNSSTQAFSWNENIQTPVVNFFTNEYAKAQAAFGDNGDLTQKAIVAGKLVGTLYLATEAGLLITGKPILARRAYNKLFAQDKKVTFNDNIEEIAASQTQGLNELSPENRKAVEQILAADKAAATQTKAQQEAQDAALARQLSGQPVVRSATSPARSTVQLAPAPRRQVPVRPACRVGRR